MTNFPFHRRIARLIIRNSGWYMILQSFLHFAMCKRFSRCMYRRTAIKRLYCIYFFNFWSILLFEFFPVFLNKSPNLHEFSVFHSSLLIPILRYVTSMPLSSLLRQERSRCSEKLKVKSYHYLVFSPLAALWLPIFVIH